MRESGRGREEREGGRGRERVGKGESGRGREEREGGRGRERVGEGERRGKGVEGGREWGRRRE